MPVDGPKYEYFPQRGLSDYEALLVECRRVGYRMTSADNTLTIKPREGGNAFTLSKGENIGLELSLTHSAQGQSSGGARSSDPSEKDTTGQRKFSINADTGEVEQTLPENTAAAGESADKFTTGSAVEPAAPRTDGATDEADKLRKRNEGRVKGIEATFSAPTTPEILSVTIDDAIRTEGISPAIDRIWVAGSITHTLNSDGFRSSGQLYSPLRNKYPAPPETLQGSGLSLVRGEGAGSNPGGLIKPIGGAVLTSPFGQRNGRLHAGVDLAAPVGTPIWAPADGVVTKPEPNPSGYGDWLIITHADGLTTRYGHLSQINVGSGSQVSQGDVIALSGGAKGAPGAGSSTGPHLHWETRNPGPVNPAQFVKL